MYIEKFLCPKGHDLTDHQNKTIAEGGKVWCNYCWPEYAPLDFSQNKRCRFHNCSRRIDNNQEWCVYHIKTCRICSARTSDAPGVEDICGNCTSIEWQKKRERERERTKTKRPGVSWMEKTISWA